MIHKYFRFYNRARADRPDYEETTVEAIHAFFTPPYYDPKGHFLAMVDNEIVADALGSRNLSYMILPEGKIGFILNVLPGYRRRGIGRQLLETAIGRFLSRGMKMAVIDDVHAKCKGSIEFYEKLGFKKAGSSYWMERDLSDLGESDSQRPEPRAYRIRSLTDRDELEEFRITVNEAFSDTLGFTPLNREQFEKRYLDRPVFDVSGFLVAVHKESNKIVGTTASLIETDDAKKETFGHIRAVGVLIPHRRKGLARSLMTRSLSWLASHNMPVARLGTNNQHAFRIYRSLGFKVLHEYARFEKAYA